MLSIGFEPWTTVSVSTVLSCLTNLCPTAIAVRDPLDWPC